MRHPHERENVERWRAERQEQRERERFAEQAASHDRYVYAERPRCPECGDVKLRSYRSIDNGDGSRTKWTKCQTCKTKFIVVLE